MAPSLKRVVLMVGCVLLAGAIISGCAGDEEYPPRPMQVSDYEVITVVDGIVLYRDFSGFDDGSGGFNVHEIGEVPIYAKRAGSDDSPVELFDDLPDEDCGSWVLSTEWVMPAPAIIGDPGAGAVRLVLLSEFGCVRVVDLDPDAETVETVAEMPGVEGFIHAQPLIDGSTLILRSAIYDEDGEIEHELRVVEFSTTGPRVVQKLPIPGRRYLFDLGGERYIGALGVSYEGFLLQRDAAEDWKVVTVPQEEIDPCYRGDVGFVQTPRGSDPIVSVGARGETLRISCEDIPAPDASRGEVVAGWVRGDTGDVYLRLATGAIVKRDGSGEGARWIDAYSVPEEFRAFVYDKDGFARSGTTHAEGEFWFSRGKDRVALMRVDLDGDDAPEWEWLVKE